MTAATCNLQRISRMLRNDLYFSSNGNTCLISNSFHEILGNSTENLSKLLKILLTKKLDKKAGILLCERMKPLSILERI